MYQLAERLGYANPDAMMREMSASQWLEWKTYMHLSPTGEELENIRNAQIVTEMWNIKITEWQCNWDASTSFDKGERPVRHQMRDHVLRFGDTPEYPSDQRRPTAQEQFDRIVDDFTVLGMKPVGG